MHFPDTSSSTLLFGLILASCNVQVFTQTSDFCIDHGYTPENGYRRPYAISGYHFFSGAVIRYYCNEYYELQPNDPIQKCGSNATDNLMWLPENPPKCVKLPICEKPDIPNATFDKEVYYKGDTMYITCDDGYLLETNDEMPLCLENGGWSIIPMCKEKPCPVPPKIDHGFYYFSRSRYEDFITVPAGTVVLYECEGGYELEPDYLEDRICQRGKWTGSSPTCERIGCDPPDRAFGDYIPEKDHYAVHDTVTYICDPDNDVIRSCQADHTWSGSPCPKYLTTTQMSHMPNDVYCTRPEQPIHGSFKCCSDAETMIGNGTEVPEYCCSKRGLLKFVCDPGYSLNGEPYQWICGANGEWLAIDTNDPGTMSTPPQCYANETRDDQSPLTDEMLKPVIGVAAGVLVVLSAAIMIALCRPKLIDMKRRWRELREDEDELIIDGRRILLPSYEEAVTSQDPYLQIANENEASSSSNSGDNAPGHSNYLRTSNPLNGPPTNDSHPSCSSDEEMLIPESRTGGANGSRPQSLVLKAGTSIDSCVVINQPPAQNPSSTPDDKNPGKDFMPSDANPQPSSSAQGTSMTEKQPSLSDERRDSSDDAMLDLASDYECNLESIYPQTLANKPQIRPMILESTNASELLNYPIIPVAHTPEDSQGQESFTISIGSESDIVVNQGMQVSIENEQTLNQIPVDAKTNAKENDEPPPVIPNSGHIHIVMSSQTPKRRHFQDEMGSTAV